MGNCTSKKSAKSLKISAAKKPIKQSKMDEEHNNHPKGLSKKVAPFTKGEITSFGFKKKSHSNLPVPVTLTSNSNTYYETTEKIGQNGKLKKDVVQKNLSEGYQSGSSIESLCHTPFRSTPKMIRKRDLINGQQQQVTSNSPGQENGSTNSNPKQGHGPNSSVTFPHGIGQTSNGEPHTNRFGFRQGTQPRTTQVSRSAFITGQRPPDTEPYSQGKRPDFSTRSKSEGPKEAFFRQNLQPSNSAQSGLNQSKLVLTGNPHPKKFTLQTSHLPRPQFAVRMPDPKTAKTATNYYRRGGVRHDTNSSKDGSMNDDSGFESHPSANSTLEKGIAILESSPGCKVRRRLPAYKGKKLEMKVVGNKFELMKKGEVMDDLDVVTEVSVIKIPVTNGLRTSTAVINTGLVEERTNQYLKRISQPYSNSKKEFDMEFRDPLGNKVRCEEKTESNSQNGHRDEGLGTESEEEKLFKDRRRSEKYLMSDGCGEADEMLPGEAMAEDDGFCLSFEEDFSVVDRKHKKPESKVVQTEVEVTPNTIRLDALKLSKELKYKNHHSHEAPKNKDGGSQLDLNLAEDRGEEAFPSDSILEQLSSDSDSLGDKGEDKNNDKEKNLKVSQMNLEAEDLGIEIGENSISSSSKDDTDVEDNELEVENSDGGDMKAGQNNCLGSTSPVSPGTPTHTSNSLSISDGRDFLIDDEIADQPQLCFSEKFVEMSCQESGKPSSEAGTNSEAEAEVRKRSNNAKNKEKAAAKEKGDVEELVIKYTVNTVNKDGRRGRLNSSGTLSPCESIASDDLMLDFDLISAEETAGRLENLNENTSLETENLVIVTTENDGTFTDKSSQKCTLRTGCGKLNKSRDGSGRSTPVTNESSMDLIQSSPNRLIPANENEKDKCIHLEKEVYQNVFQDVLSMKSMLLKLKRLLSESEGGLQENGRPHLDDAMPNNVVEDELADLRRQVLFLQQQLEEREKTVQVLQLKIDNGAGQYGDYEADSDESRKRCNAATQTGLDQFQQDFSRFRIFQTTPVV